MDFGPIQCFWSQNKSGALCPAFVGVCKGVNNSVILDTVFLLPCHLLFSCVVIVPVFSLWQVQLLPEGLNPLFLLNPLQLIHSSKLKSTHMYYTPGVLGRFLVLFCTYWAILSPCFFVCSFAFVTMLTWVSVWIVNLSRTEKIHLCVSST